jgi:amino acid transporter
MIAIMVPQVLINLFGIRLTARLNDFSVWWHIGGVLLIAGLLTIFGTHHNSAGFLFSTSPHLAARRRLRGRRGRPHRAALVIATSSSVAAVRARARTDGALRGRAGRARLRARAAAGQWTYTGYDASAHVAEETVLARSTRAWGVFLSVAVSAVVGYLLLMILTWCIPRATSRRRRTTPTPSCTSRTRISEPFLGHVVAVIIGGAMWLCGLASITSMGRMWYAFARDDGMPGARLLKRVDARRRIPTWAIVVTCILAILLPCTPPPTPW